ncbi:chloride channel protein [Deferribacter autotrophicus]|uniref:Chloride channel protein n=1 Tax=Deferribacter autotrophicus TaxID=500465 RepID=A0A5A8F8C3_9BACT|nr:chloride channel protein [Deferribacter autotrophicus]KAA0258652.1 chloride channel protein [Deferribacter autotrophicus]
MREKISRFFSEHEDLYLILISTLIGVFAGYGNFIFRYLIGFIQRIFYGSDSEYFLEVLQKTSLLKIVFVPAIGGLIVGIIALIFKSAKGHGVPDVIKVIALNRSISPSVAVIKTVSSAITLGTGGSAGREGPIVQIGAALGSGVGRIFKFSSARMKSAIAAGAAGGLAATFNAPIGGAMFAAEVLLGEFGIKTFSPIIISSVIATVISRALLGNDVTFFAPPYELKHPVELLFYIVLGVWCAFVGVIFIKTFYYFEEKFEKMNIPKFLKPAVGGLLLGIIGLFIKEVMGVGYDTIDDILYGKAPFLLVFILIFLKMIATSFTLASGGSGGLFVPSLFIGAASGGFIGTVFHYLFPSVTAGSGAYGLVAMSAMLAATMRAPLTAILIIFEITGNYQIILPLMLSTIIANIAANAMEKESIFTWILTKQGIKINKGAEEQILSSIKVKDVMLTDITTFKEDTHFKEILEGIKNAKHIYYPVLSREGYLVGMLSLDDIKGVLFEEGLEDIVVAGEICTRKGLIYVSPEDTLSTALKKLGIKDLGAVPVVEEENGKLKLLGLLRRSDIILAYNKAVTRFMENK